MRLSVRAAFLALHTITFSVILMFINYRVWIERPTAFYQMYIDHYISISDRLRPVKR